MRDTNSISQYLFVFLWKVILGGRNQIFEYTHIYTILCFEKKFSKISMWLHHWEQRRGKGGALPPSPSIKPKVFPSTFKKHLNKKLVIINVFFFFFFILFYFMDIVDSFICIFLLLIYFTKKLFDYNLFYVSNTFEKIYIFLNLLLSYFNIQNKGK